MQFQLQEVTLFKLLFHKAQLLLMVKAYHQDKVVHMMFQMVKVYNFQLMAALQLPSLTPDQIKSLLTVQSIY